MIIIVFSYFSINPYFVGNHQKHLAEMLLMSTHNICFYGERENYPIIITTYSLTIALVKKKVPHLCHTAPDKALFPAQKVLIFFSSISDLITTLCT